MKNRSAIRLLLIANFISGVAQGMSMIAVPLYFAKTQQSDWYATAYLLITCITLFWAPYAGILVDKYSRKKIFIVLMSFMGIALGGISLFGFLNGINNYLAVGAFALTFWNYSLHYLCFYAFMQEITERENYSKIASMLEIQGQLASALAGGIAALLLDDQIAQWLGMRAWYLHEIFALDACTYFIGLFIILFIRFVPQSLRAPESGNLFRRLDTGLKYLRSQPYIFIFGVVTYAVFITVLIHVFELSPTYVKNYLAVDGNEGSVFAISELSYSLGAVFAGIAIQKIFNKYSFVASIIILSLITALEYCSLIAFKSVGVFWVMSFFLGVSNAGIRVIRVSYLFKVVPNQVIGRANSIFGISNTLFRIGLLALFTLPFFHQSDNIVYSFFILVIFILLSVVALVFFYPKLILTKELRENDAE